MSQVNAELEAVQKTMMGAIDSSLNEQNHTVVPAEDAVSNVWTALPKKGGFKKGSFVDDDKPGHLPGADKRIESYTDGMAEIQEIITLISIDAKTGKQTKLDYDAKQLDLDASASIVAVALPFFRLKKKMFLEAQKQATK